MADETQERSQPIVTFTDDETGEEHAITVEQVLETIGDGGGLFSSLMDDSYSVVQGYGAGLVEIDLHPQVDFVFKSDTVTLFNGFTDAGLRPGRYFIMYAPTTGERFSETELAHIKQDSPDGLLLATDAGQLSGVGITPIPVTITPKDESGGDYEDAPYDFLALWMIQSDETGAFVTLYDLLEGITARAAVNATLERLQKSGALTFSDDGEAEETPTLSIITNAIEEIDFATDKMNRTTWNQWATLEPGQLALGFTEDGSGELGINLANSKDRKNGIQRVMTYSIDFDKLDDVHITRRLEPYDRRVYEALSSLWNHVTSKTRQDTFSLKDVHYAMGYTTEPNASQKQKINDSITKMAKAHISVDNADEAGVYHYPHFKYDASLLPMERITGYVDGQVADGLIHLFREPPLFTFARQRGQLTTYKVELLQTPLSKTNKNLLIEDYIREEIAWMKNPKSKRSNKLTLSEIFKAAGISRSDDKTRKRKAIVKLLNHYVGIGFIKGFTETTDGFVIFY